MKPPRYGPNVGYIGATKGEGHSLGAGNTWGPQGYYSTIDFGDGHGHGHGHGGDCLYGGALPRQEHCQRLFDDADVVLVGDVMLGLALRYRVA